MLALNSKTLNVQETRQLLSTSSRSYNLCHRNSATAPRIASEVVVEKRGWLQRYDIKRYASPLFFGAYVCIYLRSTSGRLVGLLVCLALASALLFLPIFGIVAIEQMFYFAGEILGKLSVREAYDSLQREDRRSPHGRSPLCSAFHLGTMYHFRLKLEPVAAFNNVFLMIKVRGLLQTPASFRKAST